MSKAFAHADSEDTPQKKKQRRKTCANPSAEYLHLVPPIDGY
jgi:hypothetical protein